jgi:peptide-methionine (S)-S-oxide reductase
MSENGASAGREVAYLGGGCFWCLEAVYKLMTGVEDVQSGYMGGHVDNPSYEQVCGGRTGHAEIVRVTFDPRITSFDDVLKVFFAIHDPTTLNRQGYDVGTQYRSAIFYTSPQQKTAAERAIADQQASGEHQDPIVTEVTEAGAFYQAEPYHDEYYFRNPDAGYCRAIIDPKVRKFLTKFGDKVRTA